MSDLNILLENENYFAVDKPAGLLVYSPSEGSKNQNTLHDLVKDKLNFERMGERSGIVHRLDADTSGIVLIAKNQESEKALKELFLHREIDKTYLALVTGELEPREGEIRIPLGRDSKDRLRIVPKESGKESITEYRVEKYFPKSDVSLLKVGLRTGRTHQIRVHFASIGHPIIGDPKYAKKRDDLKRQFLHAAEISFIDPFSKKKVEIKSELPEDLNNYLQNRVN